MPKKMQAPKKAYELMQNESFANAAPTSSFTLKECCKLLGLTDSAIEHQLEVGIFPKPDFLTYNPHFHNSKRYWRKITILRYTHLFYEKYSNSNSI